MWITRNDEDIPVNLDRCHRIKVGQLPDGDREYYVEFRFPNDDWVRYYFKDEKTRDMWRKKVLNLVNIQIVDESDPITL